MDGFDTDNMAFRAKAPLALGGYSDKERRDLLALAAQRAPDPSIFEEEDFQPFLFRVNASNQQVDSYFTKMNESSLQNYAEDANSGVQFQVNHNTGGFFSSGEVGFGRSIKGRVTGNKSSGRIFVADFYTQRGLMCGGMASDQFIDGARSGVYSDVSIGFTPGPMICNICGNDFRKKYSVEWDSPERCTHWPGDEYEVEGSRSKKKVVCVLDIHDARLNEVSVVYDGATPGAGIVAVDMARMASAHGMLTDAERALIAGIYKVRISPNDPLFQGMEVPIMTGARNKRSEAEAEGTEVEEEAATEVVAETEADETQPARKTKINLGRKAEAQTEGSQKPMERLQAKYRDSGIELDDDPYDAIEELAETVIRQHGEIEALQESAAHGREAREALLVELDREVVRAHGSDGSEARQKLHRKLVSSLTFAELRTYIAEQKSLGDERFKAGRQSRDGVEPEVPSKPRRRSSTRDQF